MHSTNVGYKEASGTLTLDHSFSSTAALLPKAARPSIPSQKAGNAALPVLNCLDNSTQGMHVLWGNLPESLVDREPALVSGIYYHRCSISTLIS